MEKTKPNLLDIITVEIIARLAAIDAGALRVLAEVEPAGGSEAGGGVPQLGPQARRAEPSKPPRGGDEWRSQRLHRARRRTHRTPRDWEIEAARDGRHCHCEPFSLSLSSMEQWSNGEGEERGLLFSVGTHGMERMVIIGRTLSIFIRETGINM